MTQFAVELSMISQIQELNGNPGIVIYWGVCKNGRNKHFTDRQKH
jgi:hypothetical protein